MKRDGLIRTTQPCARAIPPSDLAYLSTNKGAKTVVSNEPLKLDFELQPGVWVTGRVTDKQTGKGLVGHFERFTFRDNKNGGKGHVDERQSLVSDAFGRFRFPVAPGHGILGFSANQHPKYPRGAGAELIKGAKMASGISDHVWEIEELVALLDK